MNYSSMRKTLARDLRECTRCGLPAWARAHVEERVEYAAHWWRLSRDRTKASDLRRDGYMKAVRVQLSMLELLSAFRIGDDGAQARLKRTRGILGAAKG
ncbi:hypothetical protein I6G47_16380 [Delftia lacustris]|uniref:Uncharacterized protein n=1 Tax=Delftia lacustris TaxID=558537 RepID=A0A7T2YMT5_9BURK|nr:hypothetical protein [Delftia lacustris]QPS78609.1 hypothetical protein I6G47_16380 [Delftia lacustris]